MPIKALSLSATVALDPKRAFADDGLGEHHQGGSSRRRPDRLAYREGFKVYCFKTDRAIRVFGNNGYRFYVETIG